MSIVEEFEKKSRSIPHPESPKPGAWERHKERYRAELEDYRSAQHFVDEEFKAAIATELKLTRHAKFNEMYRIAYEEGHSEGYSGIYNWCLTLAPLLSD